MNIPATYHNCSVLFVAGGERLWPPCAGRGPRASPWGTCLRHYCQHQSHSERIPPQTSDTWVGRSVKVCNADYLKLYVQYMCVCIPKGAVTQNHIFCLNHCCFSTNYIGIFNLKEHRYIYTHTHIWKKCISAPLHSCNSLTHSPTLTHSHVSVLIGD